FVEVSSCMIANVAGSVEAASHVCNKNFLAAGCHMGYLAFTNVRSLSNHYLCHIQEKFHQAYLISPVREHLLGEGGKFFQRGLALLPLYFGAFNCAIEVAYRLVVDPPCDRMRDAVLTSVGKTVFHRVSPRRPGPVNKLCNERQCSHCCAANSLNCKQLFIVFWLDVIDPLEKVPVKPARHFIVCKVNRIFAKPPIECVFGSQPIN